MHVHPRALHAGGSWLAAWLAACSVEQVELGGPSLDELAVRMAEIECASNLAGDCGEPRWPDEAACVEQRAAELRDAYAEAAMGHRYDPSCADTMTDPAALEGCAQPCSIFVGDRRLGERCVHDLHGSQCAASLACLAGVCVDASMLGPGVEGDRCHDPGAGFFRACVAGLYCDDAVTEACVVAPAIGEPCAPDLGGEPWYCGTGSYCALEDRTCRALHAVGEPCGSSGSGVDACSSEHCEHDLCAPRQPIWCFVRGYVPTTGCAA
jgi:hypothetical protein